MKKGIFMRYMSQELGPEYKKFRHRDISYYLLVARYGALIDAIYEDKKQDVFPIHDNISKILVTYLKSKDFNFSKIEYDSVGTLLNKPWNGIPKLRMIAIILNLILACGLHKKEDVLKVVSHHINLGYTLGIYTKEHPAF